MLEVVVKVEGVALDEEAVAGVPEVSIGPCLIIIMEAEAPVETVTQNAHFISVDFMLDSARAVVTIQLSVNQREFTIQICA